MLKRMKVLGIMVVTIFTIQAAGIAVASGNHQDPANCDGDPSGRSDSGNGANQGGSYDNTCEELALSGETDSKNGNGDGNANGKPCAGCVGNADDKNPPGQYPDGSDNNKGYECDENKGIGRTNPAHTGCTTGTTTVITPTVVTPPVVIPPVVVVGGSNQSGPITLTLASTNTSVLGESLSRSPKGTEVLGVKVVRGMPLPTTGIGSDLMLILALSLVTIGMVAARAGRRHRIQTGGLGA